MEDSLLNFININNIDKKKIYDSLHQDILESFLCEICKYMKKSESNLLKVKNIYMRYNDDLTSIRLALRLISDCTLSDDDLLWLNKCVKCFFNKKRTRVQISESEKTLLWKKQNEKCAYCGKKLNFNDVRADHIVPWDYVGDELPNNFQILCAKCNGEKSNHVARSIHNLLFNMEGEN